MIVGVERRGGNLHAYGRRETKSAANAHSSKSESRCEESLLSTGVRSGFVKRGVHFQFRPELPIRLILEGGVQLKLLAELGCAACREVETNRGLNVEPSPTFSEGQCWREHRVACSDGLPGYVIEYTDPLTPKEVVACGFAGSCVLPTNKKKG